MSLTTIQQVSYQQRSLSGIRKRVVAMSGDWDGVDGYFETRLAELAGEIESVEKTMADFIAENKNRPAGLAD